MMTTPVASRPPPMIGSGTMSATRDYDVAVIGTGIAGGTLAAVLVKQGLKVVMIDRGEHPKFAVGESTIPQTSLNFSFLAQRFGIPELGHLAHFDTVQTHVSRSCGIKRGFNYIYHDLDAEQDVAKQNQTILNPELHLYRQDVDAYVTNLAVSMGADLHQRTSVEDVTIDGSGVSIETSKGPFTAKYVVDAAGAGAPLARLMGLRETPTRVRTTSRSIFTHMVGVNLYHNAVPEQSAPSPLGEGTLHHIFDGGWIWVIPFNNFAGATNPLCSVGLQLDENHPPTGMEPEEEFHHWLSRLPSAASQFVGARPVREWTSVDRLQYSSTRTTGERFCVLGVAAGFIDPLFSRGLVNTTEAILALAPRLVAAVAEDDFSPERFEYVETLQRNLLDNNDDLVRCSYLSWRDYDLWNAWFRMWAVAVALGGTNLKGKLAAYTETRDPAHLPDGAPPSGFFGGEPDVNPVHGRFRSFFRDATEKMYKMEAGAESPAGVTAFIFDGLREGRFMDEKFRMDDPQRRYAKLSIP